MAQILGLSMNVVFLIIGVIILITVLGQFATMDVANCPEPANNNVSKALAKSCNLTANFAGLGILITVLITIFGGIFAFGLRR